MPVIGTPIPAPTSSANSYLAAAAARTLAASIPGLSGRVVDVSTSDATLIAALEEATLRIDSAGPWQGRKYDTLPGAQPREFPRVPYDDESLDVGYPYPNGALANGRAPLLVWDLDANGQPIVPTTVLRAVVIEADAILAGDAHTARRQDRDGLASQAIAGASESYRDVSDGSARLCVRAADLLRRYRLTTGRLL